MENSGPGLKRADAQPQRMMMLASSGHIPIVDLPAEAHVIVGAFTVLGLLFWLWGHKFFKLGFVALGAIIGIVFGYVAVVGLNVPVSPLIPAGVLGVLGLMFGWMAFRIAVAAWMGGLFAIAAPIIAVPILLGTLPEGEVPDGPLSINELLIDGIPMKDGEPPSGVGKFIDIVTEEGGEDLAQTATVRIHEFIRQIFSEAETEWLDLPVRIRIGMVLGGLVAYATGFGLGMLMPKLASALLASSIGAGIWLPSVIWLGVATGIGMERFLPSRMLYMVFAWIALTVIGTILQWRGKRRRADKEGPEHTS